MDVEQRPMILWIAMALIIASCVPRAIPALWSYDDFDRYVAMASLALLLVPLLAFIANGRLTARGLLAVVFALGLFGMTFTWHMLDATTKLIAVVQTVGVGMLFAPSVTRWARAKTVRRWSVAQNVTVALNGGLVD